MARRLVAGGSLIGECCSTTEIVLDRNNCAYYYDYKMKNRVPLYLQVASLMRQNIEAQRWPCGSQIPTLVELQQQYGVSRITLRGALGYLEESGIIRRIRGRGTFVIKDLSRERWYKLPDTLEELAAKVAQLNVRLLQVEQSMNPPIPAFAFGSIGPVYQHLQRVHYYHDEPYCVIDLHLAKDIYDSDPKKFSENPAIPILVKRADINIAGARQIVRIAVADEDVAFHLKIGIGEPIAELCRTLVDDDNQIIYYANIRYPSRTIQIETNLLS